MCNNFSGDFLNVGCKKVGGAKAPLAPPVPTPMITIWIFKPYTLSWHIRIYQWTITLFFRLVMLHVLPPLTKAIGYEIVHAMKVRKDEISV